MSPHGRPKGESVILRAAHFGVRAFGTAVRRGPRLAGRRAAPGVLQ